VGQLTCNCSSIAAGYTIAGPAKKKRIQSVWNSGYGSEPTFNKDQLALYLDELLSQMGVMEYWRSREFEWPQLARMAFDFLAVPASKCGHVLGFSLINLSFVRLLALTPS
jgi:hypothetical protein